MTDEKEPKPKKRGRRVDTVPPITKAERERIEKILASVPGMGIPTGGNGKRDFGPLIEIRGEPLSETVIKARRC